VRPCCLKTPVEYRRKRNVAVKESFAMAEALLLKLVREERDSGDRSKSDSKEQR